MILTNFLDDLSDKNRRTLTYDFNSLKGIIFGISTSSTNKMDIIQTIKIKCQKNNRRDFEFFQAYYDHATGRVQKRKLRLDIFELGPRRSVSRACLRPGRSASVALL